MIYPIKIYEKDLYNNNVANEIILEVFCTDKCNYNCYYCINLMMHPVRYNKQLNLITLFNFINFLYKRFKKRIRLILIGGEPTLHTDFFIFLKHVQSLIADNILVIESFTNLSQSTLFYIKSFNYGINYMISFHYLNDNRMNDFYEKMLLFKNDYLTRISQIFIMLEQSNFDKCIKMFNQLRVIYKEKVICCLINDSNKQNFEKNRLLQYSINQINTYNNICSENKIDNNFIIHYNNNTVHKKSLYDIKNDKQFNFKYWKCNAGLDFLSIDFDGNIHPCGRLYNKTIATLDNFKMIQIKANICNSNVCCNYEIYKQKIFNCSYS